MYENYGLYILFFIVSSVIFTIMGYITRIYTGKDWYMWLTKVIIILIMVGLTIWAMTVENKTGEQLLNNIMFIINIFLYVFIPLIIGEAISYKFYEIVEGR